MATPSTKPASKRTSGTGAEPATEIAAATATQPAAKPAAKPAAATATKPATEIPAIAQKSREQLVSSLQQGQLLCVDAAQTWVNAFSALHLVDLPKIPGLLNMRDLQAATKFNFDVAFELLSAQCEFAVHLTKVLLPAKTR